MTVTFALSDVRTDRPRFSSNFSIFDVDKIKAKDVWSFVTFLLSFLMESVSVKLVSGDHSTYNTMQHVEQFLVLIISRIKPIIEFYNRICVSNVFNHLIGFPYGSATTPCTFASIEEIMNNDGGRYIYALAFEYVSKSTKPWDESKLTIASRLR